MEKLLEKIADLEKQIASAEGAKKVELESELSKVRVELSEASKRMAELEKENKSLREAQIDLELSAMVKEGKVMEDQKAIVRSLMLEGKKKEVEMLFSKPNPFKTTAKAAEAKPAAELSMSKGNKIPMIRYSEFSAMPLKKRMELVKEAEAGKLVIGDDFWRVGNSSNFEKAVKNFELSANENGVYEFITGGVSEEATGSFLLPKVWESKVLLDLGNQNYGLPAVAVKATRADAYQIAWNISGTVANQGTNINGTVTTGTTGIVISQVTCDPQWYGNRVQWEGNIEDWSVSNVKDNVIYPALVRDYNVCMDTEALNVLLASSAVLSANTVLGGTWGRGTTRLGSNGTFNNMMLLDTRVALQAKTILQDNGAQPTVGNDYVLFASGEQLFSIAAGTGWQGAMEYADSQKLLTGELGKWMGIRFVENAVIKPVTRTQRKTAAGTGTTFTAVMLGKEALGKGFDIDFQLTHYPDFALDAGRFKSLQWNSRGRFARLKASEVIPVITTIAQDLYTA